MRMMWERPLDSVVNDETVDTWKHHSARRKGPGFFARHRRRILIWTLGLLLAAFATGLIVNRNNEKETAVIRTIVHVATHRLSATPHSTATPVPVIVEFDPNIVTVSAIALGHPRVAVINGKSVAEGETLVVHTPTHSVAVTLRVLKISDGRIDLSDGSHVFSAHLTLPSSSPAANP